MVGLSVVAFYNVRMYNASIILMMNIDDMLAEATGL